MFHIISRRLFSSSHQRNKKLKDTAEQERKPSSSTVPNTASIPISGGNVVRATAEEPSSTLLVGNQIDGNTPPTREEGFIMFKSEQGSALNKIFLENKGI